VGYNCQYIIQKEKALIGVIPIGYHDGLHRHYSEKGYVLIRGKKAPMIGHICMDFMMVDLSEIEGAAVFDPVILFNTQELKPEMFASWGNTDVRELLACLGPRVKRVFINRPTSTKRVENEQIAERLPGAIRSIEKDPYSGQHLSSS